MSYISPEKIILLCTSEIRSRIYKGLSSTKKIKTRMGNLSPVWFLTYPLDPEQKTYVLLDHLKNLHKKIQGPQIREVLKQVFVIIEDLKKFKNESYITKQSQDNLSPAEREILAFYQGKLKEEIWVSVDNIITSSLDILYRYANTGLEILQESQERVKMFEVSPPVGFKGKPNFGILLLRNLITDEIVSYYWAETTTKDGKEGILMKQIKTESSVYYTMSYVWIAHEILEKTKDVERGETPRIIVCEISEDFLEDSDTVIQAKELLINKLNSEGRKNKTN